MNIVKQYRNAQKLIKQIEDGEWVVKKYESVKTIYLAERNGKELWLASGPMFLTIEQFSPRVELPDYLGIWRYWVWFKAARKLTIGNSPKPVYDEENW